MRVEGSDLEKKSGVKRWWNIKALPTIRCLWHIILAFRSKQTNEIAIEVCRKLYCFQLVRELVRWPPHGPSPLFQWWRSRNFIWFCTRVLHTKKMMLRLYREVWRSRSMSWMEPMGQEFGTIAWAQSIWIVADGSDFQKPLAKRKASFSICRVSGAAGGVEYVAACELSWVVEPLHTAAGDYVSTLGPCHNVPRWPTYVANVSNIPKQRRNRFAPTKVVGGHIWSFQFWATGTLVMLTLVHPDCSHPVVRSNSKLGAMHRIWHGRGQGHHQFVLFRQTIRHGYKRPQEFVNGCVLPCLREHLPKPCLTFYKNMWQIQQACCIKDAHGVDARWLVEGSRSPVASSNRFFAFVDAPNQIILLPLPYVTKIMHGGGPYMAVWLAGFSYFVSRMGAKSPLRLSVRPPIGCVQPSSTPSSTPLSPPSYGMTIQFSARYAAINSDIAVTGGSSTERLTTIFCGKVHNIRNRNELFHFQQLVSISKSRLLSCMRPACTMRLPSSCCVVPTFPTSRYSIPFFCSRW